VGEASGKYTRHDDGAVTHRTTDKSLLTGKSRRCSLANHNHGVVPVQPGAREVVVFAFEFESGISEQRHDPARHPFPTGVRVLGGKMYENPIVVPERLISI
jgi:hypothetical protein